MVGSSRGWFWLFTLVSFLPFQMNGNPMIMGWEEWNPYQYKDTKGETTGIDVDIAKAIFVSIAGTELTFKNMPWKRHLTELTEGRVHIAAGASKTAEREVFAIFSDPYRSESMVFYVRKDEVKKFPFNKLGDILNTEKFTLAVTRGYSYGDEYAELIKNPRFKERIEETESDKQNIKKLIGKKVDGLLIDPFVAVQLIRELDAEFLAQEKQSNKASTGIEKHPMSVYSNDIFFMFSKKSVSPDFLLTFNKTLATFKASKRYQEIMDKYLK